MKTVRGNLNKSSKFSNRDRPNRILPADAQRAFKWAEKEMIEYNCPVMENIEIIVTGEYKDPPNASVSMFYDCKTNRALCRVHWKDAKKIRYDEVANFNQLRFEANEFVTHLLKNGIKISNIYAALGY